MPNLFTSAKQHTDSKDWRPASETFFFNSGKKGQYVWTEGNDAEAISRGIYNTYTKKNLRYSQVQLPF